MGHPLLRKAQALIFFLESLKGSVFISNQKSRVYLTIKIGLRVNLLSFSYQRLKLIWKFDLSSPFLNLNIQLLNVIEISFGFELNLGFFLCCMICDI